MMLLVLLATAPFSADAKLVLPDGGATVGVPLGLVIEARHAPGGAALLPETIAWPAALAEVPRSRKHLRSDEAGVEVDRYTLSLLAFEPGEHEVPAIEVALGSTTAKTAPRWVNVSSSLSEEEQMIAGATVAEAIGELEKRAAPNPAPKVILVEDYTLAFVGGGLLLALFVGLTVWRYWKRRETQVVEAPPPPPPPPRPAHEVALERLEALRKSDHLAAKRQKLYYVELSEILRSYAGGRFEFDSVEMTVAELMATLRGLRTPGLDLAALERILLEADLVKFAKYTPSDHEAHAALNGAFEIVEKTRPREAPDAAA